MDISIQAYRCRIGTFVPKINIVLQKKTFKSMSKNYNQSTEYTIAKCFILPILLASLFIPVKNLFHLQHINTSYNHPLYPTHDCFSVHQPRPADLCSGNISADISCNFILSHGVSILGAFTFNMVTNFQSRYLHGNRRSGGIKISHWNKGPGFLQNKIPEIKNLINGLHLLIIGISEANLHQNHDQNLVQLEDYQLHICPTIENSTLKTSRVVVYTHRSLVVKLRPDLMCDKYPSIWMEVGLPRHRKFLVCQTYREWQLPNQMDRSSLSVPEQLNRWNLFLEQWERALDTGLEVHLLGDLNISHCNLREPNLPASNQTSKLQSLISAIFTRILPQGVSACCWTF